jgi:hypothetical protein
MRQKVFVTPRIATTPALPWSSFLLSTTAGTGTGGGETNNTGTTTTATDTTTTTSTSVPVAAKVAFMVTGRMKEQLLELGYTPDQIKQFKPIEASLLLEHNVPPEQQAEQLPQLVQDYEIQQIQQAQEAHEKHQQEQQQQQQAADQPTSLETPTATTSQASSSSSTETTSSSSLLQQVLGSIVSANVRGQPTSITSRTHVPSQTKTWYEVVEEYHDQDNHNNTNNNEPTGKEVVALHSTPEEAQIDADLRLELITKRAQRENKPVTTTLVVQPTTR